MQKEDSYININNSYSKRKISWIPSKTTFYCLILSLHLSAQDYNLSIISLDQPTVFQSLDLSYPSKIENIAKLYPALENCISTLQSKGYLAASVDSLYFYDSTYLAKIHLGITIHTVPPN
ncbi:MAG: hypothetical protein AAFO82_07105, partial [Bacteroidota bacterium]